MLEILQIMVSAFSIIFFWTGTVYFDLRTKKIRQEIEAQRKIEELMKNKDFIHEYLNIVANKKDAKEDSQNL